MKRLQMLIDDFEEAIQAITDEMDEVMDPCSYCSDRSSS